MPATPKQMRAAGRELRLRREGELEQEQIIGRGTRPFGAASEETLRAYASWPDPEEQRQAAKKELQMREDRTFLYADKNRPFAKATESDLRFYIHASADAIRARNGEKQ